jgi:putative ABC transport system substrate-binding protein
VVFAPAAPTLAQNSDKVWRLGVLTLPTSPSSPVFETFPSIVFPELAKQGYVEGRNLVIEIRVGAPDKLPELARELVATRPDAVDRRQLLGDRRRLRPGRRSWDRSSA